MKYVIFAFVALATTGVVHAQESKAELDALLKNMAKGTSTKISSDEIVGKLTATRSTVKAVGTEEEVKAFDAQINDADTHATAAARTELQTKRIYAESAENRRISAVREANAREEQRSIAWEKDQTEEKKNIRRDPHPLPSRNTTPCVPGESCDVNR